MMKTVNQIMWIPLLLLSLSCCATSGQQAVSRDREFQKMLDMQRQKAEASAQDMELKKLPEMGAEDHERLGDRYERQGNGFLALKEYQKALGIDATRILTRYKMGQLLMRRDLDEEAFKEFETIHTQRPTSGLGPLGKGSVYFKKGDLQQSGKHLNHALAANPRLWQAHMFLGLIHEREKNFDSAIAHHREAIAINPGLAALHNNLGVTYYLKGDYLSSIDAFLTAIETDPSSNSKVFNNLGLALARIGRYDEALSAFKKGKGEAAAYNNIGYIHLAEGKYGQATEALEKAIRINPQYYLRAHENMERAAFLKETAK